jgi:hypothetical protein
LCARSLLSGTRRPFTEDLLLGLNQADYDKYRDNGFYDIQRFVDQYISERIASPRCSSLRCLADFGDCSSVRFHSLAATWQSTLRG